MARRGCTVAFWLTLSVAAFGGPGQAQTAASFSDPLALVAWLVGHSGHEFHPEEDATTATVFSPGLRAALRTAFARSRRLGEPPCGADGDIILDTQEDGRAENVKLSAKWTAADRVAVTASFDVDGDHRSRTFLTVELDGSWKLENIVGPDGTSLRRSLACQR